MSSPQDQDVHPEPAAPQDGTSAEASPPPADDPTAEASADVSEELPPAARSAAQVTGLPALEPSSSTPDEQRAQAEKAKALPATGQFGALEDPSELPELPAPGVPLEQPPFARKAPEEAQAFWMEQIRIYEREIQHLGKDPRAAFLALEVGRIYEEQLGRPRNAATSYQRAFTLDPKNPAVLHASRRLFTEVGNWGMVLEILGFEVDGAPNPERRASLLAEKGLIQEEQLGDLDAARASFEAALEAWSAEPLAIAALERIHVMQRSYEALRDVYAQALEATDKPERRLPLLVAAGQLAEDRLEDRPAAIRRYLEVLELEPEHALALEALRRLYLAEEQWDAYVDVLTRAAQASSPEDGAQLLLSSGRVLAERLEQPDRAAHVLFEALERAPEDMIILREIERLYEDNDRKDEVAKVLARQAEVTAEPRDKVPILFKLGCVREELGQAEEAVAPLKEAVELIPAYTPAKQALGRLLGRLERYEELAELFEMEVRLEEDPAVRVSKLFQLADLRATRLDKASEAIGALRESLDIQPDYQPARKMLEALLTSTDRHEELITLYEQELDLAHDTDHEVFLLTRIATIAEDQLSDADRAARAYQGILERVPGHRQAIRSLGAIAEGNGDWREVLRLIEVEAEATEDQKEVVALASRAGDLLEHHLDDPDGAVAQYEKALTLNPTYLPALRSLGRLYATRERWADLVTMYRRELDVTRSDEHRVQLLFRIADVLADRLQDLPGAADALESVLAIEESNLPALRALADVHERAGDHEALAKDLEREARTVEDPKERAILLMRLAEVLEERLGRPDQAAEIYQVVIRLGQYLDSATRALVRIYSVEGLWNALSQALLAALEHAGSDAAKVAILLRLAEVAGDKLGNLDRAAEHLEAALEIMPEDATIANQLERNSVARRDWPRAVAVAKRLALQESDPRLFAARQIRIAQMKETQLDPPESGAEHYRLALQTVPDHPVALRCLELAYRRAGDWEALRRFYEWEARVTPDPVRQASLLARAADVAEHRVGDDVRAAALYERALELAPELLFALRGRRRVAERTGDAQVALDSIRREGEAAADPARREELLFESGRVYQEELGQIEPAIECYRKLLAQQPMHGPAFERLVGIYREGEQHEALVELYEARAAAAEPDAQADLLYEAGRAAEAAAEAPGGEPSRALGLYKRVLERQPSHVATLVRAGPLLFAAQDWDAAIDVFHRTLGVTRDAAARRTALDSLGIIYHEHRQDLVKCVQSLQAALQIDPTDVQSLERLSRVYQEAEDWTSAINVLLRLAEVQSGPRERIDTLLELARLYEERNEDDRSAILANRKVLEIEPSNQAAILSLCRLFERAKDWRSLADVSARYVSLLPPDQKDRAAPLHLKMAKVFEREMGDDGRAINALKYALEAKPDDAEALVQLARLYAKDPETAPQAVDAHRRLLRLDPFRVESYHEMHRLFERRGEHDKAFVVAEILVFLRAAHQDEELYYQEHKAKVAPHAEGSLGATDHDRMVTHPGERGPMRAVMELLGPELSKAFPGDLARYEMNRGSDRHGPKSPLAMRRLTDELAEALGGVPPYEVWVTRKYDLEIFVENERPLALVVGANIGRRIQEKDQRFLLGRAAERLKGGHHLLSRVPPKELEALVWAVAKHAEPGGQVPVDPSSLEAMQRVLRGASGRTRRALEEVGGALFNVHVDVERHRVAAGHTANRAGLVMTNDIEVAVRNVAKEQPDVRPVFRDAEGARETIGRIAAVRELLGYAVSEEYFAARAKLGFSIQS